MITRLGAAILLGSLVTVGSACAEPALDPDRFLDFGADATAALAATEAAPVTETATTGPDLAALAPEHFLDPQADATAALIASSLALAGMPPDPITPVAATETESEKPAAFALILPEPPPVGLALVLPDVPVELASVEASSIDLSDFEQAALDEPIAPVDSRIELASVETSPVDLSDFEQASLDAPIAPVDSPVDVAEALAPEHFLDARDDETLAWIAEDLAGPDIVETGSIGDGPSLMPVTGEHADFMLDLEPVAP
jgi:hypothetical protein